MFDFPNFIDPLVDYGESIVSSVIVECQCQHGNCYDVRELHTTDTGETIPVYYRSGQCESCEAAMTAATAAMNARVSLLVEWLAARAAAQAEVEAKQANYIDWLCNTNPPTIAKALQISVSDAAHLKEWAEGQN
jgi:hypothetical protein